MAETATVALDPRIASRVAAALASSESGAAALTARVAAAVPVLESCVEPGGDAQLLASALARLAAVLGFAGDGELAGGDGAPTSADSRGAPFPARAPFLATSAARDVRLLVSAERVELVLAPLEVGGASGGGDSPPAGRSSHSAADAPALPAPEEAPDGGAGGGDAAAAPAAATPPSVSVEGASSDAAPSPATDAGLPAPHAAAASRDAAASASVEPPRAALVLPTRGLRVRVGADARSLALSTALCAAPLHNAGDDTAASSSASEASSPAASESAAALCDARASLALAFPDRAARDEAVAFLRAAIDRAEGAPLSPFEHVVV
jgi:hypothetical protein